MNTSIYPQSPASVPPKLTKATSTYKSRAWMAMGGLSLFIGLYIGLTAWFAWTAWRMFSSFYQGADFEIAGAAAGVAAAFLFIFMVKALFAVKHSSEARDMEVTREEHPRLFEFLYKLADEAGAPRPHKVYLSPQVNAAVFYDLSLLNLIFPSRKNLLIGLGLVNVLNLGELKAVLAHEFGHFAQRSMAVGRWVYVAQQIAAHIIAERDALDRFLNGLSRVDIRIAWIGWILRLIVWSIRSLLDSVFTLVIMSERALSRQMEFQADLVAVSLTGSDALVHALNKLNAGDEAWNRTLNFVNQEVNEKRKVPDIFAVQTQVLEKLRKIYNDEHYGRVGPVPVEAPESHRVFTSNIASPPQMWSTHPENAAREENAKRTYVACPIDTRDAWEIFNEPAQLRNKMSEHLVASVNVELAETSLEESLKHLNKHYAKTWLMPCYRGAYLGRSIVRSAERVTDLYLPDCPKPTVADLDALYPDNLSVQLENLRELHEERHMLQALRDNVMKAAGGVIQFRGESIKRKQLPHAIAEVSREIDELEAEISAHDKKVRSLHIEAAKDLGEGWVEYLQGLAALLHFADHSEAEITDVNGYVINVWAVITADGKISEAETKRLIKAVSEAHAVMQFIYTKALELTLNAQLQKKLGFENLRAAIGEYNLPEPQRDNINEWMKVFDGWIGAFRYAFSQLKVAALEELLLAEAKVAGAFRQQKDLGDAPPAPVVPTGYKTLLPGKERELQKKLDWWDSFFTASGIFPAFARFVVAIAIVGGVLWWGQSLGNLELSIYNGLARTVNVDLNGKSVSVAPFGNTTVALSPVKQLNIVTTSKDGEVVERFTQQLGSAGFQHNVYNVAAAAPVVKWWAVYGEANQPQDKYLGAPRWLNERADYFFREPPDEIQIEGKGGTRSVLGAYGNLAPNRQLNMLESTEQAAALVRAHARWDDVNSTYYLFWLAYLSAQENALEIIRERLNTQPGDVALLRMEQNLTQDADHEAVCQQHQAQAANNPDDANWNYLAIRCMPDGPEQNAAFLAGLNKWPGNAWFSLAVGYELARAGEWQESLTQYLNAANAYKPLKVYLGDILLRIHRVSGGQNPNLDIAELAGLSDQLYYVLAMEEGSDFQGSPLLAYSHLNKGELAKALEIASADEATYKRMLMLVAASSRAQADWVDEALAAEFDFESDESLAWSTWALALREGKDTSVYADYLQALGRDYTEHVFAFVKKVQAANNSARLREAEALLRNLNPDARGYALAAAVIYTGGKCPQAWAEQASALLFANERPYLATI